MCPENALVFVAEDDVDWQGDYARWLPRAGHKVVATATSFAKASEAIPTLAEKGIQVAIVDGNLSEGRSNGIEGRLIIGQIRTLNPDIKIVGITGDPDGINGADVNIWKGDIDPTKLNETITGL